MASIPRKIITAFLEAVAFALAILATVFVTGWLTGRTFTSYVGLGSLAFIYFFIVRLFVLTVRRSAV
ncbi:MAG: hypothetical protein LKI94_07615 [Sporolactobacillus sp.]|jgi:hypothetical protein|nr:hypothetical protein [Sporolactobacillus sp.]MCI1882041.1 hypothetical protein [Sporolactobacillus sp.]